MAKGKRGKKASAKKVNGEGAGAGHNIRITKKAALEFAGRYNNIQNAKEAEAEKYKEDTAELVQEAAGAMGVSKKIARQALKEQRSEMKREEREREMEPGELVDLDKLRDALGLFADTPLAAAALAKAEKPVAEATAG